MDLPSESTRDAIRRILADNLRKTINPAISAASDNQARLDLIDESLQRTWTLRDDFFHAMNLELLAAKSQRNLHASIHKLPVELLVYIFRLSLPSPEAGPHYVRNFAMLLGVCTHWASIISAAPSLWTVVTSSCGTDFLTMALARLGSTCPLHIHCQSASEEEFAPILRQISPHIHRWETAAIVVPQSEEGRQSLSTPAPKLRRLALSIPLNTSSATEPNSQPLDIFNGSADRLEEVRVDIACLPWDSPILRGLKSLRLHFCGPIRVSNVIAILNDSPDLNTLILDKTVISVDMQTDPSNAVDMTKLENLCFAVRELQGIREIIKGFKAPICQTFEFSLETEEPEDSEEFLLTTLAPYFPFFRRMILEHPKPVINKSYEDVFDIRCSHDTEDEENVRLSLYLLETPTDVVVAFLRQVLGDGESSKPDVRVIIGRDWGMEGVSVLNQVTSYCNVVDLWLGAYQRLREFGAEDTLRSLIQPAFLPRLQRLIISGDGWDGEDVKAILQQRYDQENEHAPSLRIHLVGRGVNADFGFIYRLEEMPKIEHVSWNGGSMLMDIKDQLWEMS